MLHILLAGATACFAMQNKKNQLEISRLSEWASPRDYFKFLSRELRGTDFSLTVLSRFLELMAPNAVTITSFAFDFDETTPYDHLFSFKQLSIDV